MSANDDSTTEVPVLDPAPINSDKIKTETIEPVKVPSPPTTANFIGWALWVALCASLIWLACQDRGWKSGDDDPEIKPEVGH